MSGGPPVACSACCVCRRTSTTCGADLPLMRVGWIGGIRFGAGGAKIWARGILSPVHVSM